MGDGVCRGVRYHDPDRPCHLCGIPMKTERRPYVKPELGPVRYLRRRGGVWVAFFIGLLVGATIVGVVWNVAHRNIVRHAEGLELR